jgi:hypothetical protein
MRPFYWLGSLVAFCLAGGVLEADDIHAAIRVWGATRPLRDQLTKRRETHNEPNSVCLDLGSPEEEKTIHAFLRQHLRSCLCRTKRMRVHASAWFDLALAGCLADQVGSC